MSKTIKTITLLTAAVFSACFFDRGNSAAADQQTATAASRPASSPALDAEVAAKLIAQLSDSQVRVRDDATAKLRELGEPVRPAIREALNTITDAEAKQRLQQILKTLDVAVFLQRLKGKDFWNSEWFAAAPPDESISDLENSLNSEDPVLRLRISAILSKTRKTSNIDEKLVKKIVATVFTHLEKNLTDDTISKFCPDMGITGIFVNRNNEDNIIILIEAVGQRPRYNGGLNISYNPNDDSIVSIKHWGMIRQRPLPESQPAK